MSPRLPRPAVLAAAFAASLLLVALPGTAAAVRVVDKDDHTLDIDGALKSFFFGLHFHQQPPELLALAGLGENRGALAIADVRLKLEGSHGEHWKWQIHFRSQALGSSIPNVLGTLGTGGFARPPRALPLQATSPAGSSFQWYHELDRLNVRTRYGPVEVLLGRQVISFGVGFVWQPADLVATFSPLEVDREFKPGVDAIRINVAVGALSELALVFAAGGPACQMGRLRDGSPCSQEDTRFSSEHSVGLARLRTSVGPVDLGGLFGFVRGDLVGGIYLTAALGRFRLRTETTVTWDPRVDLRYAGDGQGGEDAVFARSVLGVDYQFDTKKALFLFGELYYNGFGTTEVHDYPLLSLRPRVAEFGEVLNLGVLYFATGVNWEPHERLPVAVTLMANLLDPSLLLTATLTYKLGDESLLVAGLYLPFAHAARYDPTLPIPIAARSEFGLYPSLYFLAWKLYF